MRKSRRRRPIYWSIAALGATLALGFQTLGPANPLSAAASSGTRNAAAAALPAPTVSPTTVAPGAAVIVSGTGCRARVLVALQKSSGEQLATQLGTPNTSGAWTISIVVPSNTPSGAYLVASSCFTYGGETAYPAVALTVSGCSTDSNGGQAHYYLTTVTQQAGDPIRFPELFSDKAVVFWCASNGVVEITAATQEPAVETAGFSYSGANIFLVGLYGVTFGVDGTKAKATISNDGGSATVTLSGMSFYQTTNIATALSILAAPLLEALTVSVVPAIRSGQLGSWAIKAKNMWGALVGKLRAHGLPKWIAEYLGTSVFEIDVMDKLERLGGDFATLAESYLASQQNPTAESVRDSLRLAFERVVARLNPKTVLWTPTIKVTVLDTPSANPSATGATGWPIRTQPIQSPMTKELR